MKKQKFDKRKAVKARFEDLKLFLDSDFDITNKPIFNDPDFQNRVCKLHALVNRLYAATFI